MIYTDTIIFDLDGTLLNTLDDLREAANYALRECGYPERSQEEIRNFIGNGVEMLIRRAVPEGVPEDKIQECLAIFKIYYLHNSDNHTRAYDGITELLQILKKKGFKIGILSNKFDRAVKKLCEDYFFGLYDTAVGESPDVAKKPSADGVNKIIKELGADKSKTVLIGDSETDVETAKNAGIYFLGVLWGYRDEQTLTEAGAKEFVNSPKMLEYIL
ncbi:MAG: HAD-IIIA family hydrolase [Candidatus Gastranaerophilales bacterium]|nr:HAD-IIIA family hydrolase [Candidatus Gastranaerophilales bacterium]